MTSRWGGPSRPARRHVEQPLQRTIADEEHPLLQLAKYLVVVASLCIIAVSVLGGGIGLAAGALTRTPGSLPLTTMGLSILTVGVGLGLGLGSQAWGSLRRKPSSCFQPRRIWVACLAVVASAAIGHLVLTSHLHTTIIFPAFHVLATGLPPLIVLAAVARGLRGSPRWREIVLQVGSGAFVSTAIALVLELLLILSLLAIGLLLIRLLAGRSDILRDLASQIRNYGQTQDASVIYPLARSPIVVAATLAIVAGLIPLIEESVKTLGVGLLAYRRPAQVDAYLWGVAGGAGFALVEGMLNTATSLDLWLPVILLRLGGTALHCTTGGLMGLAWHAVLSERGWKRGSRLFGLSIGIHGLWNALTVALTLVPIAVVHSNPGPAGEMRAGLAGVGIVAALVLLGLLMCWFLALLTRSVQRQSTPATDHLAATPGATSAHEDPAMKRPVDALDHKDDVFE